MLSRWQVDHLESDRLLLKVFSEELKPIFGLPFTNGAPLILELSLGAKDGEYCAMHKGKPFIYQPDFDLGLSFMEAFISNLDAFLSGSKGESDGNDGQKDEAESTESTLERRFV